MFEFFKEKFDNLKNVLRSSTQNLDGAISSIEDEEDDFILPGMLDFEEEKVEIE